MGRIKLNCIPRRSKTNLRRKPRPIQKAAAVILAILPILTSCLAVWFSRIGLQQRASCRSRIQSRRVLSNPKDENGPCSARPIPSSIRSRSTTARTTRWLRLRNSADRTRAHEQRLNDFRRRPAQRATARKPLLAQRVFTREPQHHSRRRSVDRCYHCLESSDFLRYPPSPARLSVSCRECAALGVVYSSSEVVGHQKSKDWSAITSGTRPR